MQAEEPLDKACRSVVEEMRDVVAEETPLLPAPMREAATLGDPQPQRDFRSGWDGYNLGSA